MLRRVDDDLEEFPRRAFGLGISREPECSCRGQSSFAAVPHVRKRFIDRSIDFRFRNILESIRTAVEEGLQLPGNFRPAL